MFFWTRLFLVAMEVVESYGLQLCNSEHSDCYQSSLVITVACALLDQKEMQSMFVDWYGMDGENNNLQTQHGRTSASACDGLDSVMRSPSRPWCPHSKYATDITLELQCLTNCCCSGLARFQKCVLVGHVGTAMLATNTHGCRSMIYNNRLQNYLTHWAA